MTELKAVRDLIRAKYSGLKVLDSPMVNEFLVRGFDQKFMELYEDFSRGDCSLGYLAEQLGITTWEAYELLEKKGLRTSNL